MGHPGGMRILAKLSRDLSQPKLGDDLRAGCQEGRLHDLFALSGNGDDYAWPCQLQSSEHLSVFEGLLQVLFGEGTALWVVLMFFDEVRQDYSFLTFNQLGDNGNAFAALHRAAEAERERYRTLVADSSDLVFNGLKKRRLIICRDQALARSGPTDDAEDDTELVINVPAALSETIQSLVQSVTTPEGLFTAMEMANSQGVADVESLLAAVPDLKAKGEEQYPDGRFPQMFRNYLIYLYSVSTQWKYYYFLSPQNPIAIRTGGIVMATESPLLPELVDLTTVFADRVHGYISTAFARTLALRNGWRSAVSAVMSRNMSHNIGSHVLARLGRSSRGGKWYTQRYLQQRMDFLGQVSTQWPVWEEPAWLLQDLVRWFLHQEEVLDYIGRSEGLQAHLFRAATGAPESEPPERSALGLDDIRLHVFLVPENLWLVAAQAGGATANERIEARVRQLKEHCVNAATSGQARRGALSCRHVEEGQDPFVRPYDCQRLLLFTPEKDEATVKTGNDVQSSVPGGLVGYQALYVILENAIRNAAKHGRRAPGEALHVVLEVFHDPEQRLRIRRSGASSSSAVPCLLVRAYDTASLLRDHDGRKVKLWGVDEVDGTDHRPQSDGRGSPRGAAEKTADGINERLQGDLVDQAGRLRSENWGLSEMKIAAAFLQGRTIGDAASGGERITGQKSDRLGDSVPDPTFLAAARCDDGSPFILRAVPSPVGTLAYEFYLTRPSVLEIVSPKFAAGLPRREKL